MIEQINELLKNVGNMHHVGFVVKDAEKTFSCMEQQLGTLKAMRYDFKPMHAFCNGIETPDYQLKIIMLNMGESNTGIEIIQPISEGYHQIVAGDGGGIHHICFAVDNYDVLREQFAAAGAEFVFESETEDAVVGYRRCFYAQDKDGNVVEIKENPYFR